MGIFECSTLGDTHGRPTTPAFTGGERMKGCTGPLAGGAAVAAAVDDGAVMVAKGHLGGSGRE